MIYPELILTFFKIGLFTIGGGYAMLPMIYDEAQKKGWMTVEELINFVAVSESTPGSFAVNAATYIGMRTGGILGAVCATAGVVLPSFIIVLIIAGFYTSFKKNKIITGCLSGLKPAVIGLIGAAVISMGQTVFFPNGPRTVISYVFVSSAVILTLMLFMQYKKANPMSIILMSAFCGIISGYAGKLLTSVG